VKGVPQSVTAVDVNGDGKVDLISADGNADTLTVMTNNGNGTFTFSAKLGVGVWPISITTADVNGDEKMDLICANDDFPGTLTVLTNNGNGTFTLSERLDVGPGPASVVAADVDGDGNMDLICANSFDNTLTVLTNNGDGTFGFWDMLGGGCTAIQVGAVVAADVNGDGKPDLVSVNPACSALSTLTVWTNTGVGTFTLSESPRVGILPASVAAADVNGDGSVDLISADWGQSTLTVLTNTGDGTFTFSARLQVGSDPWSVVAADVNGDGKPDLICANLNEKLMVLTNNGTGTFTRSAILGVGSHPGCVVAADVNGDGKLDVISANTIDESITVFLNSPARPLLGIRPTVSNTAVVSWSAAVPGYVLQQSSILDTNRWATATNSVNKVSGIYQLLVELSAGTRFYRLFHP